MSIVFLHLRIQASRVKTHAEAHGLLPSEICLELTDGKDRQQRIKPTITSMYKLGAGNVTAAAVAGAHQKDLAVEGKYKVNFINYWVNGKRRCSDVFIADTA